MTDICYTKCEKCQSCFDKDTREPNDSVYSATSWEGFRYATHQHCHTCNKYTAQTSKRVPTGTLSVDNQ